MRVLQLSSVQKLLLGIKSLQMQLGAIHPCCQQHSGDLPTAWEPTLPWGSVLLMDYELFTKTVTVSKAAAVRLCTSLGLGGFSAAH